MDSLKRAVLVVDDEAVNRRIIKKCMERDYTILEAGDGFEALSVLDAHPDVSAILLDIVMPKMGGIQFLDEMSTRSYASIPVIVMTADHTSNTELEALRHGATDFVGKPFQPQILLSRVNNAIARSQVALYEKMQYISDHDVLTGLLRREKMFEQTHRLLLENPTTRFVFLRLDIDRFRLYNTSYGEQEGDSLLRHLAAIVGNLAQAEAPSVTGRLNADVFCICMPYDAEKFAAQIGAAGSKLTAYRNDYMLKLCAGAYLIEDISIPVEEMNIRAAAAAQKCKGNYNSNLGIYDAQEARQAEQEIEITNEMRTALKEEQFVIFLQPKYRLADETAAGAEALVRWKHPQKGLISPGIFIPLFEKNGFIAELDQYIWEHVCMLLRAWLDAGHTPCPVSTNISRISLYNPRLVSVLVALVKKYKLPPELLQLEVTESAYMSDPDLMRTTMHGLHQAGFTLLMDDFGSGYSSLNTLKDIDVDILKIDMKFLPTDGNMERGEIILASVVRMANWLGMAVVVEGVETKRQRDFINGIGGEYIQGYYYARPMPNEDYFDKYVCQAQVATQRVEQENADIIAEVGGPAVPLHNLTVLVIDDDVTSRALLYTFFCSLYHVELANSVADGLDYLRKHSNKVQLILVDNIMEGMSGMDFLEYCRTDEMLASIPKIMITANDTDADQVAAFRMGAYDYITKPLVQEIVQARVNHALKISSQVRSTAAMTLQQQSIMQRDASTGLLSNEAFTRVAAQVLLSHPEVPKALLQIRIDHGELLLAKYDAYESNELLRCIANVLRGVFHNADLLSHDGGGLFTVLKSQVTENDQVKDKSILLVKAIASAVHKELQRDITCSIGLALTMEDDTLNDLTARANTALQEANSAGDEQVRLFGEHITPIREEDTKPIVLVCTKDDQLFNSMALGYGDSVAFAQISDFDTLADLLDRYAARIKIICLDEKRSNLPDSDKLYEYVLACGGGDTIALYSICQQGNLTQLRHALTLNINDIILLPPQMDVIRHQLTKGLSGQK